MSKVIDDTLRDSFSKVVAKIGRDVVLWHAGSMNLGEQNGGKESMQQRWHAKLLRHVVLTCAACPV